MTTSIGGARYLELTNVLWDEIAKLAGLPPERIIHNPTLILAGAQDRVMPPVLTEELAKKIPHAQFKVFPHGAHLLFLEEADSVNRVLLDFLSERKVE